MEDTLTRSGRVSIADSWPGQPRTLDGLAEKLRELAPAAPVLAAALVEWCEHIGSPIPPTGGRAARVPAGSLPAGHPRRRPPTRKRQKADVAAALAGYLVAELVRVPALLADLDRLARAVPADPREARPLYGWTHAADRPPAPDIARRRVVDLGSDQVAPYSDQTMRVVWMPAPAAIAVGVSLWNSPPELMTTSTGPTFSPGDVLAHYVSTLRQLRDQGEHWRAAWQSVSDHRSIPSNARKRLHATYDRYRGWVARLQPLAERLITEWAASIHQTRQALSALADSEGLNLPMSTLTSTSVIAELAAGIRDRITAGYGGRITVTDDETAFSWGAGLPRTLVSLVTIAQVAGRHIDAVRVTPTAGDLGSTAEGGTKPNVATFATESVDLAKYAALVVISVESAQFVASIEAAIAQVMTSKILRGIEADLAAAMIADAGNAVAATDLAAGVLEAIAAVAAAGGQADLLALAPADYVTLMSAQSQSGYMSFSRPEDGPGLFLGLRPVIVPSLAEGTSLVADGRSVVAYEAAGAPLCAVDTGSKLATNEIQVAIETWSAGVVANPGAVAVVTVTATP